MSTIAELPILTYILRLSPATRTIVSGAIVSIFLHLMFSKGKKKSKYVKDLSTIGKRVAASTTFIEPSSPEYDVVVVGGGWFQSPKFNIRVYITDRI